jgi:hypothetical protein
MNSKVALSAFLALLSIDAALASTLRCGNRLVSVDDKKYEVLEKCGQPTFAEQRTEYVEVSEESPDGTIQQGRAQSIHIDEWTYDFGPRRLVHELVFENGVLKDIETLGYGSRKR